VEPGQFIQWHDLFVIIDNGSISLTRYGVIETAMREQAKLFPQGIACLGILPMDAKPPPDDVKRAVKSLLTRMAPSLSCIGYVIEGTGFKGVAARATLVGMKIFASRPYPIYVEVSLHEALTKMLPHLHHGRTVTSDVNVIAQVIAEARMGPMVPPPVSGREGIAAK
jgi:hypothetical protein